MLITERLLLRAVEPKDVNYLFKEENNTEVWNLSSTIIPFSKRTFEDYANSIHDLTAQKQFRFIIELKDSAKVIGMPHNYGRLEVGAPANLTLFHYQTGDDRLQYDELRFLNLK